MEKRLTKPLLTFFSVSITRLNGYSGHLLILRLVIANKRKVTHVK